MFTTSCTRVPCLSPFQAATLAEFLTAEEHFASWIVADGDGPIVLTTAPELAINQARNALQMGA
jgi:hypothetical protein